MLPFVCLIHQNCFVAFFLSKHNLPLQKSEERRKVSQQINYKMVSLLEMITNWTIDVLDEWPGLSSTSKWGEIMQNMYAMHAYKSSLPLQKDC